MAGQCLVFYKNIKYFKQRTKEETFQSGYLQKLFIDLIYLKTVQWTHMSEVVPLKNCSSEEINTNWDDNAHNF